MSQFVALQAEQYQDIKHALKWWRETGDMAKGAVWDMIQKTAINPHEECMLRFAQIGMTHIALLAEERKEMTK